MNDALEATVGPAAELLDGLAQHGITATVAQIYQYGAYINWLLPNVSIEAALWACCDDGDCYDALTDWLANPNAPQAGCERFEKPNA